MASTHRRKQLALDTNILFDLAAELDAAHDFRETFQKAGYSLRIPPTAVQELAWAMEHAATSQKRQQARRALENLLRWDITPFDLQAVGHGITAECAKRLIRDQLLPDTEYNDGLILAETSLAEIPMLVTSDKHLLDMDEAALGLVLDDCDLFHVRPCHPKLLLRAIR
jgi:predicted nucleic acid-binding protein